MLHHSVEGYRLGLVEMSCIVDLLLSENDGWMGIGLPIGTPDGNVIMVMNYLSLPLARCFMQPSQYKSCLHLCMTPEPVMIE